MCADSGQKFRHLFADDFAVGAAGGFGLDRLDDLTHLFPAHGAGLLNRVADQLFEFFGRERPGQERFETVISRLSLAASSGRPPLSYCSNGLAPFFHFFMDDRDDLGVRSVSVLRSI